MKTLIILIIELENFMLPCFTKKFLGFDCPGCGLQRSAALLLKGEFIAAFKMYPAIYGILVLLGFLTINNFYKIRHSNIVISSLLIITAATIITNYILKFT